MPFLKKTILITSIILSLLACSAYASAEQSRQFTRAVAIRTEIGIHPLELASSLLQADLGGNSKKSFINLPPVAQNIFATTFEDKPVSGSLLGTDPDGDPLNYSVITYPSNGTLTINHDGTYVYKPNAKYSGTDSFTYQVTDPTGASDKAIVDILIDQVSNFPAFYD